jgi:predicted enzyme related to lactoylglutathione lyase
MPNSIVHFEIGCKDAAKTTEFFTNLFDWQVRPSPNMTTVLAGPGGIGGHISAMGHEPHNYTLIYVQVDDVQAYLEKAAALGGKTVVPPVTIPDGTFAWLADPEGNNIGLWKPAQA